MQWIAGRSVSQVCTLSRLSGSLHRRQSPRDPPSLLTSWIVDLSCYSLTAPLSWCLWWWVDCIRIQKHWEGHWRTTALPQQLLKQDASCLLPSPALRVWTGWKHSIMSTFIKKQNKNIAHRYYSVIFRGCEDHFNILNINSIISAAHTARFTSQYYSLR